MKQIAYTFILLAVSATNTLATEKPQLNAELEFGSHPVLKCKSGSDNDTIEGGESSNLIYGGGGNDNLESNDSNDRIEGGAGFDKLRGNWGNDTLIDGNNTVKEREVIRTRVRPVRPHRNRVIVVK